jgi:hypothetical protein
MDTLQKSRSFTALTPMPSATVRAPHTPTPSRPTVTSSLMAPRFSMGQLYVAWEAMKQRGGLYLIYGDAYVLELTQKMLSRPLLTRTPVVIVDGNNNFDLHLYTRMAQHFARRPEEFLRLIKISRAFTCHQMVSLAERVQKTAEKHQTSLVVALSPLATFDDENVPSFEANQLFHKLQRIFRDLARSGLKVLLACPETTLKQRPQYLQALKREAIFRLACERRAPTELTLRLERPEPFKQTWTLTSNSVAPIRYSRQLTLFQ